MNQYSGTPLVVSSAVRTPVGRFGGSLRSVPTVDLGAIVVREAVARAGVSPAAVDAVFLGTCLPGPPMTAARVAALLAGMPQSTLSLTIDRACCSAMTAVGLAAGQLLAGAANVVVAGGMENMSATPLLQPTRWGHRLGDLTLSDPLIIRNPVLDQPVARYTGEVSLEFGLGREAQDSWALLSQRRWEAAAAAGRFSSETVPVPVGDMEVTIDEQPRPDTSLEKLARLKTVYGSPTVTAGNAPGLNDGASALVITTAGFAERNGLPVLAHLRSYGAVAGDPRYAAALPADAIDKALALGKLELDAIDLLEINEAFAATPLVSTKVLSDHHECDVEALRERTNVDGGAVAIGHPIGASGARIVTHMVHELRRRGGGLGAAAICGGAGQSDAIVIQVSAG